MIKNEKGGGNTKTDLVGGQTIMSTYFIKCDVCNKDIITQHHNAKYCPDCKKHEKKATNHSC